ncbi:MAG: glucose-1-phosphate thymidylyltransferase [Gemmatimonadales bacterium]|nr:MAG: glucose-1-phosphate thymidylyltransferase [Gemmatimonadales bacterium]
MIEVEEVISLPARRGIILAGGLGTRLHPMTVPVSKQLLPVYDKPMIYYPLSVLMLSGVRDIALITTPRDQPQFQQLLGDGSKWGLEFTYLTQHGPGGVAEAYLVAEDFLAGAPSMMMLGDNVLYGSHLRDALERAAVPRPGAQIFAYRVRNPEAFGVVSLDSGGHPVELVEKPEHPDSPWAVIGLYMLDGDAPARARQMSRSSRGELEIIPLLDSYLNEGRLEVEVLGRGISWLDTGTPQSLLQASQFVSVLQERQGLQVACPEEIAYRMGFIDAAALSDLAAGLKRTQYGAYLERLAEEDPGVG